MFSYGVIDGSAERLISPAEAPALPVEDECGDAFVSRIHELPPVIPITERFPALPKNGQIQPTSCAIAFPSPKCTRDSCSLFDAYNAFEIGYRGIISLKMSIHPDEKCNGVSHSEMFAAFNMFHLE